MSQNIVLSVTALNRYVHSLLEEDPNLKFIYVTGEISNFKAHYASGHLYFSLKDDGGVIRSVMFRSSASRLKWTPENGMKVICRGRVSLYEKDGQYQLYVDDMQPDGLGALSLAAEQLRRKLAEEGLFDEENKQPIPPYPEEIAVVTSDTGAAVKDIMSVLGRRFPYAKILMCPVLVQGESAAADIAATLDRLARLETSDVIILGRGGGSIEDLWAFNEEILVRAVAACPIPIISAVGHETDYTLCDLAADFRAPTPSAAAEMAVPEQSHVYDILRGARYSMDGAINRQLTEKQFLLNRLKAHPALKSPEYLADRLSQQLDTMSERMKRAQDNSLERLGARLGAGAAALNALSPLNVLARGYTIAADETKALKSAADITEGRRVNLRFNDGTVRFNADNVEVELNEKN